jgi:hypothetical protein
MGLGSSQKYLHGAVATGLIFVVGCGSSSNLNRIWGYEPSAETQLSGAKEAYDRGDFAKAISLTSSLLEANPDHEEAAIVQGYAYISQGGLDPFRVASCLISQSSTSTSKSSTSTNSTRCNSTSASASGLVSIDDPIEAWFTADTGSGTTSSTSDDSSVLKKLQSGLLTLTPEDFSKLKKGDFTSTSGLFLGDNSLIIPAEVSEDLRDSVNILRNLSSSVKSVCRFVNDTSSVKTDSDRYKGYGCDLTGYTRRNSAKAHYLWALSHLGEALTFTSVILYSTGGGSTYNFQKASSTLAAQSSASVDKVVAEVEEMQQAIAAIFDTENSNSMISKTLYDLNATSGAFDAIAGLPDSVKSTIAKIIEGVKTAGKTISGSGGETKALKARLLDSVTTAVAKKMNETITSVVKASGGPSDPNAITPAIVQSLPTAQKEQVTKLCSSYASLTKDSPADKAAASKPKACG